MLVLTRRPGQTIRIGDHIVVTVLAVKGQLVEIGIAAPKHVPVHRGEVYDRIAAQSGGHVGVGVPKRAAHGN